MDMSLFAWRNDVHMPARITHSEGGFFEATVGFYMLLKILGSILVDF